MAPMRDEVHIVWKARIVVKSCIVGRGAFSPRRESVIFSIYMPVRFFETLKSSPWSNIQWRVFPKQCVNAGGKKKIAVRDPERPTEEVDKTQSAKFNRLFDDSENVAFEKITRKGHCLILEY